MACCFETAVATAPNSVGGRSATTAAKLAAAAGGGSGAATGGDAGAAAAGSFAVCGRRCRLALPPGLVSAAWV